MATEGVIISKSKPGVSIIGASDGVSAIIATGVAVANKLAYGDLKTVYSIADLEALGLNAKYDTDNKCTLYRQCSEFYRMAGSGTKLYLMLVAQTATMSQLVEDADKAKQLILASEGDINQIGVILCPAATYAPTQLNGMNADVLGAIAKAQALADFALTNNRPLHIVLEGRNYGGNAAAAQDLRKIQDVEAPNVSVVALQDYDFATITGGAATYYGDVGLVLGLMAKAAVSQNIAEVASFNIQNVGLDRYKTVGLSSHHTIAEKASDIATLDTKAWIIAIKYADYNGIYLNDDPSCVSEKKDANGNMNESSIWKSRTLNKVVRAVRRALLPEVKKRFPTDANTGLLTKDALAMLQSICERAVDPMVAAGDITGVSVKIDPNSELFVGSRTLNITSIKVAGVGNIGLIKANVGLSTNTN